MEKPSLALWRKKVRTLNNKIARSFFALTACIAMAFGFFACSNGADDNTALLAALLASKQQTQSNGGGQDSNPTPSPATTTPAPTTTDPTPAATYTITFNANDGSENPATVTQNFTAGVPQELIPVEELGFSKEGFNFAGWGRAPKSTQASYADGASYTATAPATLYALWSEIPVYSVNIPVNENGGVTATPATGSAGTEITLLAAPNAGYEFGAFTVTAEDGTDVPVTGNAFTMPDCNVSVSAAFAKIDYSITILAAENGGVFTENATANYGDTVTLTITPDEGYALATLTYALQDEEPVNIGGSGRQRSFAMPLGDVTIAATFTTIAFSVNVADSIEGGTVAATPTNANAGDQITLVPMANAGWQFVSWNAVAEGGTPVTVENNKFTMPAKSVSVSATFEKINYSITVLPNDNGSVTGLPATATVGTEVSLTASPANGYQFEAFVVAAEGGGNVIVKDGKFSMPASNVTVTAVFSRITYKIDVGAAENGIVTASAAAAAEGADVTLDIAPASGYALEALTVTAVDGSLVSVSGTDTAKNFKMPAQSVAVSASFVLIDALMRGLPLTLEAIEAGVVVTFTNNAAGPVTYKVNGGAPQTIASEATGTITLENEGDKVAFYGDNETYTTTHKYSVTTLKYSKIACDKDCYVYGNIMSLVKSGSFASADTLSAASTFSSLFSGNSHIKNKDGAELLLPATTLVGSCYEGMFEGCVSLTRAPKLPATTLVRYCYEGMFEGCVSLTRAPKLPATTLVPSCYRNMFSGCTSLTEAPDLSATTLAGYCYQGMFKGCASLTRAPKLPATTLAECCYYDMFNGCTSLTEAPDLSATTLAEWCYRAMFYGCTSLTRAPNLPATTLADSCYESMFSGCTSLTEAPELPATALASSCYIAMFYGCTSLTSLTRAPALPATTLAPSCYQSMFSGCASLTSAPELPATALKTSCYQSMFYRCTSLTSASVLSATTLAESCYREMFSGCTKLSIVTCLATNIRATDCTKDWLNGVADQGTFMNADGVPWPSGSSGIPNGWTVSEPLPLYAIEIADGVTNGTIVADKTSATYETPITLTIKPEDGYELETFAVKDSSGNSVTVSGTGDTRTFIMPAKNVTVTATFKAIKYSITLKKYGSGYLSSSTSKAIVGTAIELRLYPDDGYELIGVIVKDSNGTVVPTSGTGNTNTFTMPASNVTVTVTYQAVNYNISLNTAEHGRISSDRATATIGTKVTITASPASGYDFVRLHVTTDKGTTVVVSGTGNSRTFIMPGKNVSVAPVFLPQLPSGKYRKIGTTEPSESCETTFDIVAFGIWPQTIKNGYITVDKSSWREVGEFTYCLGSDGQYYAELQENGWPINHPNYGSYSREELTPKYSDGTAVHAGVGNYKWFKVEPIKWRVLTTNYNGTNKKLLLVEDILVAKRYGSKGDNKYRTSEIRMWLNSNKEKGLAESDYENAGGFLKTAFTSAEQAQIAVTSVDNSALSTNPQSKVFNSGKNPNAENAPTKDKVFLLSEREATTSSYGLFFYGGKIGGCVPINETHGWLRLQYSSLIRLLTDYAKASGVIGNSISAYDVTVKLYGHWWLRSPSYDSSDSAYIVKQGTGYDTGAYYETVEDKFVGIVPALCVE